MVSKMKKISLKTIIIASASFLALVIGIIVTIVIVCNKADEEYRNIKVYKIDGTSEVYRGNDDLNLEPYVDMKLENNDSVKTFDESYLYLKLDMDKYLLSEPNTLFDLVASGSENNSKTKIVLKKGAITIHVTEKLGDEEEFIVSVNNTTMAIRGTSLRVSIIEENGVNRICLEVFDGKVFVQYGEIEKEVLEGSTAMFVENDIDLSNALDYYDLEIETLEFLNFGIDEGNELTASKEEIKNIIDRKTQTYTVKYIYNDSVFAILENVAYSQTIKEPSLKPTENGYWNYDFSKPITDNIEIIWVE